MHKLWSVTVATVPAAADAMAAGLEPDSLALTILMPPRQNTARIEALYNCAPEGAGVTARLAIIAALRGLLRLAYQPNRPGAMREHRPKRLRHLSLPARMNESPAKRRHSVASPGFGD